MGVVDGCTECLRLWSDYSAATKDHIRLEGKLSIAELSHDDETVRLLAPLVASARSARTAARAAFQTHQRDSHPAAGAAEA
jgi:hypothetical protein